MHSANNTVLNSIFGREGELTLLYAMMNQLSDGICIINQDYKIVEANQSYADMLGYDRDELLNLHIWDWDAKFSKEEVFRHFADFATVKTNFSSLHRRKNGDVYHADITVAGAQINGQSMAFCIIRDVTEKQNTTNELKEFKNIIDQITDCVFTFEPDSLKFIFTNKGAEQQIGYSSSELCKMHPFDIKPQYVEGKFRQLIAPLLRHEKQILSFETVHRHRDGYDIDVSVNLQLIEDVQRKKRFVAIVRDISEQKAFEKHMIQAQKMEAIGRLAGGIAHDFNNQLASIMGFAELIDSANDLGEAKNYAKKVITAAQRSSDLTRQLLTFSGKDNLMLETFDIHHLIVQAVDILALSVNKNIDIKTSLSAEKSMVHGDKSLILNAFINLGLNAAEVMAEGGLITISSQYLTAADSLPQELLIDKQHTSFVELQVRDIGHGISTEHLPRIFEPFFTTKSLGKSSGLGLASVQGAIKQNGGAITVESKLGEGTNFKIHLPVIENSENIASVAANHSTANTGKELTILLVDDEPLIRELCEKFLSLLGHKIILASDGLEAFKLYKNNVQQIDLVLMDMMMPNMNGKEAFRLMKSIEPSVRVIISSGFSADNTASGLIAEGVKGFIRKPYKLSDLQESITAVMNLS
jgi:two-component system, cell cycle sensor histidine kinase and response regulator CckA